MSDWPNWDAQVLAAIGAPLTKQNLAVVDAEQIVEGAGGRYNPYNIGYYGTNPQYHGYTPFGYGTPSPYPPTLDFPSSKAGVWATSKWYGSNAPELLAALEVGNPLNTGVNWEIHMGASTPDPQYTANVRSIALALLSGQRAKPSEDYGGAASGGNSAGGTGPAPSNPTGPPSLPAGCGSDPNCGIPAALMAEFKKSGDPTGALGDCTNVSIGLGWTQACASACCEIALGANAGGGVNVGPPPSCAFGLFNNSSAFCQIINFFNNIINFLTSGAGWARIGEIILGVILLWIGLSRAIKAIPGPGAVAGGAGRAAVSVVK